ncbi:MAG: hypothetical protein WKF43_02360 [Acidimicrobiales bacterium]
MAPPRPGIAGGGAILGAALALVGVAVLRATASSGAGTSGG